MVDKRVKDPMNIKMFKKVNQSEYNLSGQDKNSNSTESNISYSLKQLISYDKEFLKNQIFTTGKQQPKDKDIIVSFQYVQILTNIIESEDDEEGADKILVQIIDYSDKFFYKSIKEEQNF